MIAAPSAMPGSSMRLPGRPFAKRCTTPDAEPTQTVPLRSCSTAVMLASGSGSGPLPPCGQASSATPAARTCSRPVTLAAHIPPSASGARDTTLEPP